MATLRIPGNSGSHSVPVPKFSSTNISHLLLKAVLITPTARLLRSTMAGCASLRSHPKSERDVNFSAVRFYGRSSLTRVGRMDYAASWADFHFRIEPMVLRTVYRLRRGGRRTMNGN